MGTEGRRGRARYISSGRHVVVDGRPIENLPAGTRVIIDTASLDAAGAAHTAATTEQIAEQQAGAIQKLIGFVTAHSESLVRRVRTAGAGDDALDDYVGLSSALDRFSVDGNVGDELRRLGLLDGTREELFDEIESARGGEGVIVGLHRRLSARVIDAIAGTFRAPEVHNNLGANSPNGLAETIADELLIHDADFFRPDDELYPES